MAYRVAFWNVENLFAPEGFAGRVPWLQEAMARDLEGWTQALYERKLSQLALVMSEMADGNGPDILGVCEVENRFVLEALAAAASALLPERAYRVVHADNSSDKRGIDTAFIYDERVFSADEEAVFSHFVIRRTGTRDITQATFKAVRTGSELVALCNHWPSRSGGALESAGFRAVAGETLAYWHERTREVRGDDIPIIALGDFNDDPFDASIRYNSNASRERGDVVRSRSARFYNLAWHYLEQKVTDHRGDPRTIDGTLYYGGNGNCFDQILANRSLLTGERGLAVVEDSARIEAVPRMVDHRVGQGPMRFGLPKGNASKNVDENGFSDHFPVSVAIEDRA